MSPHQIAEQLAAELTTANFNEADTRHKIINRLLHEVLAWPHSAVACEQNVADGYIDYVLTDGAGRPALVIEAKRTGKYFQLPRGVAEGTDLKRMRLKTLTTNREIRAAVTQVMAYCPQVGSEYACITNGSEFIIFRTFIRGRDFTEADALVIPSLSYFSEKFTEADNFLSYEAVAKSRSLHTVLDPGRGTTRELYYPKNGIGHYDAAFARNEYAKYLDPIARRYFTDISPTDDRMMRFCYVFAQGTHEAEANLKTRLTDQLTPFFSNDGAVEISQTRSGGSFTQRIARSLAAAKTDVLIVYGGKGAGKSTFIRRLLYHDPPPELQLHAFPIIIDFLQAPQQSDPLVHYVWAQAVTALDQDELLSGPIEQLVELFGDRFAVANRQELSAYPAGGIDYLRERNKLIALWREDKPYVTRRFVEYWKAKGKGLVICFDNTDQLPPRLQDLCFLTAQNVARELSSVVIISMREERYCRARTVGVLDAYHNSGYHLAAPDLQYVFTKRLRFLLNDLTKAPKGPILDVLPADSPFQKLAAFFVVCLRQFVRTQNNAMSRFLRECSRDNTRLALEFFRQFVTSGYTHIQEMMASPHWTVIEHQVIKPMMIPERYNYDENKSLIPNLFQCRSASHGSHFTAIRILRMLRQGIRTTPEKGGYWRVDALCDDYETTFSMRGDYEACLDVLLRHGLIESNNRLDAYSVEKGGLTTTQEFIYADEVRITAFGMYMHDFLCQGFAYLDLVSLDTGLSSESLYNEFCEAAVAERNFGAAGDKLKRLASRMRRAKLFVQYLTDEEEREVQEYQLPTTDRITPGITEYFAKDAQRVEASALRNVPSASGARPKRIVPRQSRPPTRSKVSNR